ncbi:MAG: gas vesicle protein [Paracoccaceae bacterium]
MSSGETDTALIEVLDRLLDRGVVLRGEIWLTVADIELVFIGAELVIAGAERMRQSRASGLRCP